MNKADVIQSVSEQTGIAPELCEKILKAFENEVGDNLSATLKGQDGERTGMLARISQQTGASEADCDRVVSTAAEVVKAGIADKLGVLKGLFSRS
jgi:nucleoid DNA-binding protein